MEATRNELTGRWSMTGVEPSEVTFERMCKMLREGENFKFARYGDGEFNCMFGKIGRNCDGHEYFPDLGMALNDAFYSDPKYMVGIQPLSVQGGLYQKAISQREGYPKNIYDADVLHSASIDGNIDLLLQSLQSRTVFSVGPLHLNNLFPGAKESMLINDKNCWLQYEKIVRLIEHSFDWDESPVFLLCASMMSEVIIDRFKDSTGTFIDCGSVFDPYCGKLSRKYHHKLQLNANL